MTGIEEYGEVWSGTKVIGGVDSWIGSLSKVRADCSSEVAAGAEADYSDLVWVNMPIRGVLAHET